MTAMKKGKKSQLVGYWVTYAVFLCFLNLVSYLHLCYSQAGEMDAGQLVTIFTFKDHLEMSPLTIFTVQRHSKGQAQ